MESSQTLQGSGKNEWVDLSSPHYGQAYTFIVAVCAKMDFESQFLAVWLISWDNLPGGSGLSL